VDGIVTDSALAPLDRVTVFIAGTNVSVTTGPNGRFRIAAITAGEFLLGARRVGYAQMIEPVAIDADTLRISLTLSPIAAALDTVRSQARSLPLRLVDFYERRRRGDGHFITADEIAARGNATLGDLLRPILGVRVQERNNVETAYSARSVAKCPMQIFVDDQLISVPVAGPVNLRDLPAPSTIAGIEVYSGPATIPLQYKRADTMCGMILIWTKVGSD